MARALALSHSVVSDPLRLQGGTVARQAPLSHGISQARMLDWVAIFFSRGSPDPAIEPMFPELQADSLLSEPPGKPIKMAIPPN